MALSTTPLGALLDCEITQETDIENTGYKNVRGAPVNLHAVELTAAAACFFKLWDSDGDDLDLDGSDQCDMIIKLPIGETVAFTIFSDGLPLSNGLSFAASQVAGDDLTDAPADSLIGRFVTSRG
jgi:hypothetical protein